MEDADGSQRCSNDSLMATAKRGALLGLSAGVDIAVNYPPWIIAKRVGAGLGMPALNDLYKGGGLLWVSLGPTYVCEDLGSRIFPPAVRVACGHALSDDGEEAVAAALAGAFTGVAVSSPIENVLTRAHKHGSSTMCAARDVICQGGLVGTFFPRGAVAMAGREIPFSLGLFYLRERVVNKMHDLGDAHQPHANGGPASAWGRWWAAEITASLTTSAFVNIASHPASVVLAQQQAHDLPLATALSRLWADGLVKGFYAGYLFRTVAIAGTMTVVPLVIRAGPLLGLSS
eukprot:TRINITY_DN38110_c0_g1_i1.p1 TRINITY_DN38110_c0_g1~~TRINITY_DN38110_c0_g1_i1.p1  ORF type:complete len:288 (+),score=32.40 TRINITY_DN38110_c0_g1_i1:178-1041(+)